MTEEFTISKDRNLLESENYAFLRKIGIKHIEKLSGEIWTDYNTHDPGISILELLCYAITDLSYRTSFDIKDILTARPDSPELKSKSFYTAAEIFPCNPVSVNDFRKLVVDAEGVRNAWFETSKNSEIPFYMDYESQSLTFDSVTGDKLIQLNGIYDVLIEFEESIKSISEKNMIIAAVREKLHEHRNLCEDFLSITAVNHEDIAVCAEIEIRRDTDVETVLAQIYNELEQYFSPRINFYTIEELLKKGKTVDSIFEGPLLNHGFIDDEEIKQADLRRELRVSDIINFIMDIDGVVAVKNILLTSYINGVPSQIDKKWILKLSEGNISARLDREKSKFIFYKDVYPFLANKEDVEKKLIELKELKRHRLSGHKRDLPVPSGEFKNIEDYYPVQHEFPLCYGIGEMGLPGSATPLRKAQAKQLKAYLLFFEQILANYFSQLANVRNLFSIDENISKTYFTQALAGIKDVEALYLNYNAYKNNLNSLVENKSLFEERRNRFLSHLMGRFCEEMEEYGRLLFTLLGDNTNKELIKDKIAFLSNYPEISSDRGKAFNYIKVDKVWDTNNVTGMKKRICGLLGIENSKRRTLASKHINIIKLGDKYAIRLSDPNAPSKPLLTSMKYPNEECAASMLQYILAHGDNRENYSLTTETGKYRYNLKNDCDEIIANSRKYSQEAERDGDFEKVIEYFKEHTDIEGFHLIEHILLRPKSENKLEKLLPVCICEPEQKPEKSIPLYKFEVFKDKPKAAGRKFEWRFRLKDSTGNIILKSEGYTTLNNCIKDIVSVKKNTLDKDEDFKTLTAKDGTFYFNLIADNNEIIGTSKFTATKKELLEEIADMKKYMSFRYDLFSEDVDKQKLSALYEKYIHSEEIDDKSETTESEDHVCGHEVDPYSFRISVILPSWPQKFRNINFRRFVEQNIRMETPAHIFPRICWINLEQMRDLEESYRAWLVEIKNDAPKPIVVNKLIDILFNLKNVYPTARLHDCEHGGGDDPQVILGYTSLGII